MTAALAAVALAVAGCGGGESGGSASAPPTGSTATQPPPTLPGSPPLHRNRPPAIPLDRGAGPPIGGTARLVYTTSTFRQLPQDFVTGGIPVGTRAGDCAVIAITPRLRVELQTAVERQTPRGVVEPLSPLDILLADCGDEGRWAMVTWIQQQPGRADTTWVDELRDDGGGIWSGTARGVKPGCRMPRAAAAAWQLDVTICPPPARPRPRATPPPPTPRQGPRDPRRRGGPLDGLPPGSRARKRRAAPGAGGGAAHATALATTPAAARSSPCPGRRRRTSTPGR